MRNNLFTWRMLPLAALLFLVALPLQAIPWSSGFQQETNQNQFQNTLTSNVFVGSFGVDGMNSSSFAPNVDCLNTTRYPFDAVVAPTSNIPQTIQSCNFAGEYFEVSGIAVGAVYRFGSSVATDYYTVRQGTVNGPILAQGVQPLSVTIAAAGNLFVHINSDSNCGSAGGCRETSITCVSCVPIPCSTPTIATFPFTEGFEANSPTRTCWSNEYVTGTTSWTYSAGAGNGAITTAHSGALNARFYVTSTGPRTKLVSPKFNFTNKEGATLNFWYGNQEWFGDQNELRIFYKVANGAWTLIPGAEYTSDVSTWTQVTLNLPESDGVAEYTLAFEGYSDYGRGIVLDDVVVDAEDTAPSVVYCIPTATNSARYVNNFSTTGGVQNISNLATGFSAGGYGDYFDTHTVEQVAGSTVNFSTDIVGGTAGFRIWVDWNQDGVFNITEEVAYHSTGYKSNHTGSFVVPTNALIGTTRMRIVSHYLNSQGLVDPCITGYTNGEFEDYKFVVTPMADCAGTPNGGTLTLTPTTGNPGSAYTVSVAGYTVANGMSYQWQSNTDGAGWVDVGTASGNYSNYSATAPAALGVEVEWRLKVTCTVSNESAFSSTATFTTVLVYCNPTISSTVEPITRVSFADIDNSSPVNSTIKLEDFTSIVGNVELEETYDIALEGFTGGNFTNFFTVWIDWNQNGTFEGTEMYPIGSIVNSTGADGKQALGSITVPADATEGSTRMRVIKNFGSSPTNPCGSYSFGQIEDYTLIVSDGVVEPEGCLGAPNGQWPSTTFTPACNGLAQVITTAGYTGEFSKLNVVTGTEYTFSSSIATDYVTISNEAGTEVYAAGVSPLVWTATNSEVVRFYVHLADDCTYSSVSRSRIVKCGTPIIIEEPDFDCFQGDGITSSFDNGYGITTSAVFRVADDFIVAEDIEFTIQQITIDVLSTTAVTNAVINIRTDASGAPGGISETVTMAPSSSITYATAFNFPIHHLTFDLATPIVLTEGTYWLEPNMTNANNSSVYWLATSTGSNGAVIQQSGDTGTTWTPDPDGLQAVFFVAGECELIDDPIDYCTPEGTNSGRYINNFSTTGGLQNISNLGSGFSTGGYGDFFDTHTLEAIQGEEVDFTADFVGGTFGFRIWVDWNQDGVFDVTEEVAYASSGYASSRSGSFEIPTDALLGTTRMRIVNHWLSTSGDIDPCATGFTYGEFEDYKVVVTPMADCSGTPDGGTITLTPASGNTGTTYVVSSTGYTVANGMTYQWQSNTDGAGWINEGTATTSYSNYTATAPSEFGVSVDWRLEVTCTLSSETAYSDIQTFTTVMTYCVPTFSTVEAITRVVYSDIDNTSPAVSTLGYEDFTAIQGNVEQGEPYAIALEGNTNGNYKNYFTVWVDWNQNGTFDTNEMYPIGMIENSTGTDGKQAVGTVIVPAGAPLGSTRMRVIKNFNSSPTNPCGSYSFGQAEDYTIIVAEGDGPGDTGLTCEDQTVPSNNLENGLFFGGDTNQRLAVDVVVGDNGFTVYGVEMNVFTDGVTDLEFSFIFYDDAGGLPGAQSSTVTGSVTDSELIGNAFGFDVYTYTVAFDTPVAFAANSVSWMEVDSDGLAWEATTANTLGSLGAFMNDNTSGAWVIGTSEYVYTFICEELGVSDMNSFDFAYYPNPVKDVLNIKSQKAVKLVEAFNLTGQKVVSSTKVLNGQINVSSLTTGTYVFRVTMDDGQVETFKIIKK